jgi:ABC-2 type transport system ATP-binding protein
VQEAQLALIPDAHDLRTGNGRIRFTADSDRLAPVLAALAQLDAKSLTVAPPSLEELFLRHYGDELAEVEQQEAQATGR